MHVFKPCAQIMPKGRAYIPMLGDKTLADRVPDPELVRIHRK